MTPPAVFAVHIADNYLFPGWIVGGFVLTLVGVVLALWRIDDREIPRVGVLTAAFFVASLIHIPFGPISIHLLLNGLVGVILRHRAPLAILVGLALQYFLFGHGGWTTLGVNFVVLSAPAVAAGVAFRTVGRSYSPMIRGVLIGVFTTTITVLLNATVLYFGSIDPKGFIAGVSLVAHLPVVVIEGLVVGSACRVLAKAKPEWLGTPQPADEVREG